MKIIDASAAWLRQRHIAGRPDRGVASQDYSTPTRPETRRWQASGKASGGIDPAAFAETERDPVTRTDVETALRQVMTHAAKPQDGSENREPMRKELSQRYRLKRR